MRFILHSDLNSFFASVECLYNPSIRNCAVVVTGAVEKRHGIVLAKNQKAKAYGIKTGDTVWQAREKCAEKLVQVPANFDLYYKVSKKVKAIYGEYTNRVESFGIDEAWIDISNKVKNWDEAVKLADEIRNRVFEEVGITVSIGVSFNKIFSKLGSDIKKPNATTLIADYNFKDIVWKLPVQDLMYVGRATKQKLNRHNIFTIGDLANADVAFMKNLMGKNGVMIWEMANGLENGEVKLTEEKEAVKSIGNSTTTPRDLKTDKEVKTVIYILAESVAKRMRAEGFWCNEVALTIRDSSLDFTDHQKKLPYPTNLAGDIAEACMQIFKEHYHWHNTIRLLGVRASGFDAKPKQYNFLIDEKSNLKKEQMETTVENLRARFGYDIIKRGVVVCDKDMNSLNPYSTQHKIHPISYRS